MTDPTDHAPAPSTLQRALYWFCWWAVMFILTVVYRMRLYGARHVPRTGALLIAANHESHLDPPLVGMLCRERPLHFLARAGLFRNPVFAWLITALNSVPVSEDGSADLNAIRAILTRLERGVPVLIFPEGSRSPDGSIQEFKRGVALLMKRAGCPVLPVAVVGCYHAWPRHRRFPRLRGARIAAMAGRPIPADELLKDGPEAALQRLRSEIESLRANLRRRMGMEACGADAPAEAPAAAH